MTHRYKVINTKSTPSKINNYNISLKSFKDGWLTMFSVRLFYNLIVESKKEKRYVNINPGIWCSLFLVDVEIGINDIDGTTMRPLIILALNSRKCVLMFWRISRLPHKL